MDVLDLYDVAETLTFDSAEEFAWTHDLSRMDRREQFDRAGDDCSTQLALLDMIDEKIEMRREILNRRMAEIEMVKDEREAVVNV